MISWEKLQTVSFLELSAREKAISLLDQGSFHELVSPFDRMSSPHLELLGEAVEFDDGLVTGIGKLGERPIYIISQEGRFIGGSLGEVGGAKFVSLLRNARQASEELKSAGVPEDKLPMVICSFETGGVRLQEANAGLLAHAEIMNELALNRNKVPTIALIGSKLGCFGGMGFVAAAMDITVMSEFGRIGLTGPEVIEQEMGKEEFDASDRGLIYRTTGARHRYIMGDCDYLVENTALSFRETLKKISSLSIGDIDKFRKIGSAELVMKQLKYVSLCAQIKPMDSLDIWKYAGNTDPEGLIDMSVPEFLKNVKRLIL